MPVDQIATRVQAAAEDTLRVVTDVVEVTMQASFDVAQRVLEGQKAVVATLLPEKK
jgi:hypothetical protein